MLPITVLLSALWVWSPEPLPERNGYVAFRQAFVGDGRPVTLRVAAGGEFAAELNGRVVSFGTYRDFPDHPAYNEVEVPTRRGTNELAIGVFHSGNGFGSHSDGTPGLWAEVLDATGGKVAETGDAGS